MSEEKNFVDGLLVKLPDDKAPDFVKLKLSLKLDELGAWIATQKREDSALEWINLRSRKVDLASGMPSVICGSHQMMHSLRHPHRHKTYPGE